MSAATRTPSARVVRRLAHGPHRRARPPPPPDEPLGLTCRDLPVARRPRLSDSGPGRPARRSDVGDKGRVSMAELSVGDQAPASSSRTPRATRTRSRRNGAGRPRWCSRATTVRMRSRGTTASSTSRGTTSSRGARVLLISPNDAARYPRDSYEAMQKRVRDDGGWPAPYLYDETQDVARAYGAKTTPDVFLVDAEGRLRYRGAPDADYNDPDQNAAVAARRARRGARGPRPRAGGDGPGRLQHQVDSSTRPRFAAKRTRLLTKRSALRARSGPAPTGARRDSPRRGWRGTRGRRSPSSRPPARARARGCA